MIMSSWRLTGAMLALALLASLLISPAHSQAVETIHPWRFISPGNGGSCSSSVRFEGENIPNGLTYAVDGVEVFDEDSRGFEPNSRGEVTVTASLPQGTTTPDSLTKTFRGLIGNGYSCDPLGLNPEATQTWCSNRDYRKNVTRISTATVASSHNEPVTWTLQPHGGGVVLASGRATAPYSVDTSKMYFDLNQPRSLAAGRYELQLVLPMLKFAGDVQYPSILNIDVADCVQRKAMTCDAVTLHNPSKVPVTAFTTKDDHTQFTSVALGQTKSIYLGFSTNPRVLEWSAWSYSPEAPTAEFPDAGRPRQIGRGGEGDGLGVTSRMPLCSLVAVTPKITGTAKKGKTVKAVAGNWKPTGVTFSYRWNRNGKSISGATKSSYKLVKKDKRKRITVTITGTKAGYTTTARTSAATKKVK